MKHHPRVTTPTVLQMEAVECGAAALGIILAYYKRIVPLPELRQECGVSRDGSKAANLVKAARQYGLQAKGFKKQIEQLQEIQPPYIVFWNFNHFLVVEGFVGDRVYLNDPAIGPRSISLIEFDQAYTGVVLLMEPGPEFKPGGRKPSLTLALSKRLRGSIGAIAYCLLAGLLLVIPGLIVPVFSQVFVDQILVEQRQDWLRPLLFAMAVVTLLQGALTGLQYRYLRQLKIKLSVSMSSRFLWHVLRLPAQFYAQRFAGEISSRVRLNDRVAHILSGELATSTINLVMLVFYAAVMFAYDFWLTLIGVGFAILNVAALQAVARQRTDSYLRLAQENGKVAGVSIAALQSMETLKASALESDFFARWSGYYTRAANTQQELEVANQLLNVLPTLLTTLTLMLVLVIGGLRVMQGHLSLGMLIAFQSLMQSFQEPIAQLVQFGSQLQELEGDLTRLDDVLNNAIDPQVESANSPNSALFSLAAAPPQLSGQIEIRNLTFGYSHVSPPLIEDFSCLIQPGQRIALVGGSGSGKSTIAKLVTGLYEPWSGEILFDGIPLRQIPRSVLTNSLSLVDQDIFLFEGTLWDNLTLWDSTLTDHQVMQACQDAAIWETVLATPGGLEGELLEGAANLSGGQRQRLEIARALVNEPTILVMDEATSALDAETEQRIDRTLRKRGCTCLIVAHRLSTIRDCDEIIVLEQGKVVQRGTHPELIQTEGSYARLIQTEG